MDTENVFAEEAIRRYEHFCVGVHNCTTLEKLMDHGWLSRLDPWVMVASHIRNKLIAHGELAPNEALAYSRLTEEIFIRMREHKKNRK